MKRLPFLSSALFLLLGFGPLACGSEGGPSDQAGSGGDASPGVGGDVATGGVSENTGGAPAGSGGLTSSGGSAAGGASSGDGGTSTGGALTPSGGAPGTGGGDTAAGGGDTAAGGGDTAAGGDGPVDTCDPNLRKANRDATRSAITGLFIDKNPAAIDQYWADPYLQHNPIAQSGVATFKSLMSSLVTSQSFSYTLHRTLADCELSVVLGTYSQTGVIFDMFRVEDGKLIEHWDSDSGQASGVMPMPSGDVPHDETANSAESELVVRGFIETVLIGGDRDAAADYLGSGYFDHRSGAAVGPDSIFPHLESITYEKIHHLIADGNYVFVLSEGKRSGAGYGFYDLFRIEDGKIVERWDSRRQVPNSTTSGLPIF
ncbi:MAG: hypothetical protein B6A08_13135 [Sorangiineae bacterium NIC37A_2]|nr:MAG: hypothetical protein B6A08_13135 [Sorangiineae bacterium NIC37A_2]